MGLIAEVIIPQMFTAYKQDLHYPDQNGLHHYQYFCEECDQAFMAAWGMKPGAYWPVEKGAYFYCPNCGKQHHEHVVCLSPDEEGPNSMRMTVKVYDHIVTFGVTAKTVEFRGNMRVFEGIYKETIRFDLASRTVIFHQNSNGVDKETFEIGNPFELDFLDKSILWYFQPCSLANKHQKKELNRILKVLREAVHSKLEKRIGHKVSSMYVSHGQHHGFFLLPILNMAYRVLCPDAPNLPSIYRETRGNISLFWKYKMYDMDNSNYMDSVISVRRKNGFIPAMIEANSLPDTAFVRRVISEDPFDVAMLKKAFSLCSNYDLAVRLFAKLKELCSIHYTSNKDLINFLRWMKAIYGETGIVKMVEDHKELRLDDCIRLFQQLSKENRKAIKTEAVRLRDLHDWMSIKHKKQGHVNLKFNVPAHIVKRLSMQKDRLKFFLPKESMQLLEAGMELHNCVASYGRDMKDNKKWIVLVADDNGRLAACLEVQGKELKQAKIDRNKPVSVDSKLNAEILSWAKNSGIEIKTSDVSVAVKEETMSMTG